MSRSQRLAVTMAAAAAMAASVAVGCTPTTPPAPWAAAGCYNSPVADSPDLRFNGTANAADNLTVSLDLSSFALSTDGTCAGLPLGAPYALSLVRAADSAAAEARCVTLGLDNGVGQIQSEYPTFPADAWVCNPAPADAG